MNRSISILLNLLRVLAALAVFTCHCTQPFFSTGWVDYSVYAVAAVPVFFVISGCVIRFVTDGRENTARAYATARIARLYSVLVPAVLLSAAVFFFLQHAKPGFLDALWVGQFRSSTLAQHPTLRFLGQCFVSLLFLNNVHGHAVSLIDNGPVWSLGFEAMYYLIFGIALFRRGTRRVALLLLVALVVGVPTLQLMPVWLIGVALYAATKRILTASPRRRIPGVLCLLLFSAGLLLWRHVLHMLYEAALPWPLESLLRGRAHASDAGLFFYCGLMTALLILGAAYFEQTFAVVLLPLERPIRWCAAHTFSLYLFHMPLLILVAATVPYNHASAAQKIMVAAAVLAACVALSTISESRKTWWLRHVNKALQRLPSSF